MIVIIPASGKSKRFRDAGYNVPKHLLPMPDGGKMIDWVQDSVPKWFYRDGYVVDYVDDSFGPLDTILKSNIGCRLDVLIVYCDVILNRNVMSRFIYKCKTDARDGCIVFKSNNPRFGYVSDGLANSGVFYFRSWRDFCRRAEKVNAPDVGVPSVFDDSVLYFEVDEGDILDLGTPEEYERIMQGD